MRLAAQIQRYGTCAWYSRETRGRQVKATGGSECNVQYSTALYTVSDVPRALVLR